MLEIAERLALELAVAAVDQEAVLRFEHLDQRSPGHIERVGETVERDGTEAFLGDSVKPLVNAQSRTVWFSRACRSVAVVHPSALMSSVLDFSP